MKKFITILFILTCLIFFSDNAYADEFTDYSEIENAVPKSAQEYLDENGITPENNGILDLSLDKIFGSLLTLLTENITKPLKMLCMLCGVVLMCALAEAMKNAGNAVGTAKACELVGVLAGTGMLTVYISDCINSASGVLNGGGSFMLTFLPVFAGIVAVNGHVSTAAVSYSTIMIAVQFFSQFAVAVILPFTTCILGITAAGAVNPELKIQNIAETVKKIIVWTLGLLMTIFTGLLSLQSLVSSSADNVAMRAAKFAVSSGVPIVGGAVSEAMSTLYGSMSVIKTSVGTYAIIAAVAIILPTIISAVCYRLALMLGTLLSDLFGLNALTAVLKSGESIMSVIIALLICFLMLAVIASSLIMAITAGGGY